MAFDENLRSDVSSVLNAAGILDITEYDLFHLAYLRWYGDSADEPTMEPHFAGYMFRERVPPWVRHFARLVESLYRRGQLDRDALGVTRRIGSQAMVNRGLRYAVIVGLWLATLIVAAQFVAEFIQLGDRCMFPPCY
jgi:hypothetical protein